MRDRRWVTDGGNFAKGWHSPAKNFLHRSNISPPSGPNLTAICFRFPTKNLQNITSRTDFTQDRNNTTLNVQCVMRKKKTFDFPESPKPWDWVGVVHSCPNKKYVSLCKRAFRNDENLYIFIPCCCIDRIYIYLSECTASATETFLWQESFWGEHHPWQYPHHPDWIRHHPQ